VSCAEPRVNEDTWTLIMAKEHARAFNLAYGLCLSCHRPMIFALGLIRIPPKTCGRMICGETMFEPWAKR